MLRVECTSTEIHLAYSNYWKQQQDQKTSRDTKDDQRFVFYNCYVPLICLCIKLRITFDADEIVSITSLIK